jgi:glutaconate CoA-transferase subunit A
MSKRHDKVVSLTEAASEIRNGWNLTLGGFAHSLAPMAFVREMIRQGKRDLEMTSVAECWPADMLAGAGALRRVRFSNFMFEGFGRTYNFSRAVEQGHIQVEDHSHFGLATRLAAAGLGLPFLPVRSMLGSDILAVSGFEANGKFVEMTSPFSGERVALVSAVHPDAAILHAARADRDGNLQVFGTTAVIEEQARSANLVIASVEELVDSDVIRRSPEFTIVPGFLVDMVALAPWGAHPTGMYRYYEHDTAHIERYYAASRSDDLFTRYLDEFVFAPRDHWAYLRRIGVTHLLSLRTDPALGYIYRRPNAHV